MKCLGICLLLGLMILTFSVHGEDYGAARKATVNYVDAEAAHNIVLEDPSIQVLDVRTAKEYAKGHIKGALNVDFYADDFLWPSLANWIRLKRIWYIADRVEEVLDLWKFYSQWAFKK